MIRSALGVVLLAVPSLAQDLALHAALPAAPEHVLYDLLNGNVAPLQPGQIPGHLGPDVVYANEGSRDFYLPLAPGHRRVFDGGRMPSDTSPAPSQGTRECYLINSFRIAYCTSEATNRVVVRFYSRYADCVSDPAHIASYVLDLPGSTDGSERCYVATVDLGNRAFSMDADGNGAFEGAGAVDTFGWSIEWSDPNAAAGPVIAGSCDPAHPAPGQGTAFDAPGTPFDQTTGLDTGDRFLGDDANGLPATCFYFGGCPSNGPFASFSLALLADTSRACERSIGTPYCDGAVHFGAEARARAEGSAVAGQVGLFIVGEPLPPTKALVFFGTTELAHPTPFGDGLRCVGGQVRRLFPLLCCGSTSYRVAFDPSAAYASAVMPGTSLSFQFWIRSVMGSDPNGDGLFQPSTTNAVTVIFQ